MSAPRRRGSDAGSDGAPDAPSAVYVEPARGYGTAYALLALMLAGMSADLALGGPAIHVLGWLLGIVIVVGIIAFGIRTARRLRSIVVTEDEVRVGTAALSRATILSADRDIERTTPVLGQQLREGLPRGVRGLALHLADGGVIAIPTRRPQQLADVLAPGTVLADSANAPTIAGAAQDREVRLAEPADLAELADIDHRAATLFRVSGIELPAIAFDVAGLDDARAIFVAGRPPIGFARVDEIDRLAHLQELAVVPSAMRHGVGSALLQACCAWAAGQGYRAITLITFAAVPWNAPFYQRRGFGPLDQITPELAALRSAEHDAGLDAVGQRVVLRREL